MTLDLRTLRVPPNTTDFTKVTSRQLVLSTLFKISTYSKSNMCFSSFEIEVMKPLERVN